MYLEEIADLDNFEKDHMIANLYDSKNVSVAKMKFLKKKTH